MTVRKPACCGSLVIVAAIALTLVVPPTALADPAEPGAAELRKLDATAGAEVVNLMKVGSFEAAELAARALLAQAQRDCPQDCLAVAEAMHLIAAARLNGLKSSGDTLDLVERSLRLQERILGTEHPDLTRILRVFSTYYDLTDQYEKEEAIIRRAVSLRDRPGVPEDLELCNVLRDWGWALTMVNKWDEAIPVLRRALAVHERIGGDDVDRTHLMQTLARVLLRNVDPEYLVLSRKILEIRQQRLPPNHYLVGEALVNVGSSLLQEGDYAAALPMLERGAAVLEEALGPEDGGVGQALLELGRAHLLLGDSAQAIPVLEKAIPVIEKAFGPNGQWAGTAAEELGLAQLDIGALEEARGNFGRALEIYRAVFSKDIVVPRAMDHVARASSRMHDHARARSLSEEALRILPDAVGGPYDVAAIFASAGSIALRAGEYQRASQLYARALEVRAELPFQEHLRADAELGLARAHRWLGDMTQSLARALEAERAARHHLELTSHVLSERGTIAFGRTLTSGVDLALEILEVSPPGRVSARAVWDAVLSARGAVLDEMATRHRAVSASEDAETAAARARWVDARTSLAKLVLKEPGAEEGEAHGQQLERARAEKESAERALAVHSAAFRQEKRLSEATLKEVVRALGPDKALLAYVRYRHEPRGPTHARQADSYAFAALVQAGDAQEPVFVPLGPADRIEGLIAAWRADLSRFAKSPASGAYAERSNRSHGLQVRRAIWDPVAPHLGSARRVLVVMEGALTLVDLSVLPSDDNSYLAERGPLLHYLSTERDLLVEDPPAVNRGLLALGAPAFDDRPSIATLETNHSTSTTNAGAEAAIYRGPRSSCPSFAGIEFEPIPASADEVAEVGRIWQSTLGSPAVLPADQGIILTGVSASEGELRLRAAGRRVLHLATHGFFLGNCPSKLTAQAVTAENPLLLSGLVLAGANRRQAAGVHEDDGILTAEEAATLDLHGVEWVVLSACDTGLGEIQAGEGVFGLRRAFEIAGARGVIMSLWPVDDETTRRWMQQLYRAKFERRLDTAEAVRAANLDLLHRRRARRESTHPFFWAGFVAVGDWR